MVVLRDPIVIFTLPKCRILPKVDYETILSSFRSSAALQSVILDSSAVCQVRYPGSSCMVGHGIFCNVYFLILVVTVSCDVLCITRQVTRAMHHDV